MGCPLDVPLPAAPIGSEHRPLRVASVGSGPAGFFAASAIAKRPNLHVCIDMYERLPTPYGLVRGGVAPDHQDIKNVVRIYERRALSARFRFLGNVTLGRDVQVDELRRHYDTIIYAVGAANGRAVRIPGHQLPQSHLATSFVGWYNGHPDYRHETFDLSVKRAIVIGNGNVAIDVARLLLRSADELSKTDIAEHALTALARSQIEEVMVVGRRGPLQVSFTPKELSELSTLTDVHVAVDPREITLEPQSLRDLQSAPGAKKKVLARLKQFADERPRLGGRKRTLSFRFKRTPTEIIADDDGRVCAMTLRHNKLVRSDDGTLRPQLTDHSEVVDVGLVIWAIGFRGSPIAGVPFDEARGVIENDHGRVKKNGVVMPGEYVVGWAGEGASGLIGAHKAASAKVVSRMLDDLATGQIAPKALPAPRDLDQRLAERGVRVVRFADWQALDAVERGRGAERGAPRAKITAVEEMLALLDPC